MPHSLAPLRNYCEYVYITDKIVSKLEVEAALVKLMNPAYRSTIETILTSTDIIDNIIAKSKQLQKDLVAQSKCY